jgi:hypothetical protein
MESLPLASKHMAARRWRTIASHGSKIIPIIIGQIAKVARLGPSPLAKAN